MSPRRMTLLAPRAARDPTRPVYRMAPWRPWPGTPPTHEELRRLAATLRLGRKEGARALGVGESVLRNTLACLYVRLEADNALEAASKVGWLTIPSEYEPPEARWDSNAAVPVAVRSDMAPPGSRLCGPCLRLLSELVR